MPPIKAKKAQILVRSGPSSAVDVPVGTVVLHMGAMLPKWRRRAFASAGWMAQTAAEMASM